MQRVRPRKKLANQALPFAMSALVLLGAIVALGLAGGSRGRNSTGLMPEVVVIADQPRLVVHEVIVRAAHPGRLAGTAARLPEVN